MFYRKTGFVDKANAQPGVLWAGHSQQDWRVKGNQVAEEKIP
jgi:hypothetical protein